MPNIKSSIKRTRSSAKKTAANKIQKSKVRTMMKKTKAAIHASDDHAGELYRETQAALDKAAAKGLLHPNNVARKKSRLAKSLAASKK